MSAELEALLALPLTVEGRARRGEELFSWASALSQREDHLGDLGRFLLDWLSPSPVMEIPTSGSTGEPKRFQAEKLRMAASARATCQALRLEPGDSALLCMPLRYVAARMVVARALVRGLDLLPVRPSASPLAHAEGRVDFAAMTPMQAYESLKEEAAAERLFRVRRLLLGGGAVSPELESLLRHHPHEVWSSYGMTETLSHVALRRVNGPSASDLYEPLPGVSVRVTAQGTLAVTAPAVADAELATRDLAEVTEDGRFRVLGRLDNVAVTGGVKVRLEEVEELLAPHLRAPFCAASVPDPSLGRRVVLLLEGDFDQDEALALCRRVLPRHWAPKNVLATRCVPRTDTGKIARKAAGELAERLYSASLRP